MADESFDYAKYGKLALETGLGFFGKDKGKPAAQTLAPAAPAPVYQAPPAKFWDTKTIVIGAIAVLVGVVTLGLVFRKSGK
jgi:hypothetical protein